MRIDRATLQPMRVLALDVDGVLLDSERGGAGHWSDELARRHGVERAQLREHFFAPHWSDVVEGRRAIEPTLATAIAAIGVDVTVEQVLECWFDADFVPIESALGLARRAHSAGVRVVLATNQEHRRAADLRERFQAMIDIDDLVYSAELGCQKHDPRFFDLATKRLDVVDRSEITFVDDALRNVTTARSAGWTALHAADHHGWIAAVESSFVG